MLSWSETSPSVNHLYNNVCRSKREYVQGCGSASGAHFETFLWRAQHDLPWAVKFQRAHRLSNDLNWFRLECVHAKRSRYKRDMRTTVFGIAIDVVSLAMAAERIVMWLYEDAIGRVVITPNLDHAVQFGKNPALRHAYEKAALVVADGAPLVWASRLGGGAELPERVAGSDLAPLVLKLGASRGVSVFLLGAGPGVAERARAQIETIYPGVQVIGVESPPFGFEKDLAYCRALAQRLSALRPQLLLVGLGAPKQELWATEYAGQLGAKVILCVGATIDFLAGEIPRAPLWMQRRGLEWLYRASTQPGRLVPRYARNAWYLPGLLWQQSQSAKGSPQKR